MGTQRAVEVAAKDGGYRVTTFCRSLPEAMATVDKILHCAPPEAFEPVPAEGDGLGKRRYFEATTLDAPIPTEEELAARAPNALASEDDNTGALTGGTVPPP
jgi:hypothetical protein